jgi:hypothetical protein
VPANATLLAESAPVKFQPTGGAPSGALRYAFAPAPHVCAHADVADACAQIPAAEHARAGALCALHGRARCACCGGGERRGRLRGLERAHGGSPGAHGRARCACACARACVRALLVSVCVLFFLVCAVSALAFLHDTRN